MRQLLDGVAPGAIEWAPFASYRGVEVMRVVGRERDHEVALYYALAGDNLVLTFNRSVMRWLIEQALEQEAARFQPCPRLPPLRENATARSSLSSRPRKKGALRTCLSWALAIAGLEGAAHARGVAEAVLRGVPESAHKPERSAELSLAYLGEAPLTPDGRRYSLSPEGITDPLRAATMLRSGPRCPHQTQPRTTC